MTDTLKMTDENKQALDRLESRINQFTRDLKLKDEKGLIKQNSDWIAMLRAALQPKPSVDVEFNWSKGFPQENGTYLVELEDGEHLVTYYTHEPRHDTWGDKSRTGWTCLTGSRAKVKRWVKTNHLHSQGHLNQGWRDIESAPKDGKIIQLYGLNYLGKKRTINARYTKKHNEIAEGCDDVEWLDEHNDEYYYPEGWYEISWCNDDYHMYKVTDHCIKPTHWMPLPQPPSEGE